MIVWPEATTPWAVRGDERTHAWIESLAPRARAPMVLGSIAIEHPGRPDEAWYNGLFVVTPDGGVQPAYYAKRHLVPFGEYVPLRPVLGWLDKVVPVGADDFQRGHSSAPLLVPLPGGTLAVGPLICFEDIFPSLARDDVLRRRGLPVRGDQQRLVWRGRGRLPARRALGPARRRDAAPGAALRQRRLERLDRRVRRDPRRAHQRRRQHLFPRRRRRSR